MLHGAMVVELEEVEECGVGGGASTLPFTEYPFGARPGSWGPGRHEILRLLVPRRR